MNPLREGRIELSGAAAELLERALASPDAPLVFADSQGQSLRDFRVPMVQEEQTREFTLIESRGRGAAAWYDSVSVTNDGCLLQYLTVRDRAIPVFPAAGDRPAYLLNPRQVRVGVLTTGGPAPGLCAVVDSIVKRQHRLARRCAQEGKGEPVVWGYLGGFEGLATGRKALLVPAQRMKPSDPNIDVLVTDDRALEAATFLKTSRFNLKPAAGKEADAVHARWQAVLDGVFGDDLDILYLIGGDGTLTAAQELRARFNADARAAAYRAQRGGRELIIVAAPKTMDNDVQYADTTFGFTTTVDHLVEAIHTFHTTVVCQDRLGLMQVFGAASGFVALYAAFCSGDVDYVVLPEEVERRGIELLCGDRAPQVIDAARFVGIRQALKQLAPHISREQIQAVGFEECLRACMEQVRNKLRERQHALVVIAEGAPKVFQQTSGNNPWQQVVGHVKRELAATVGRDAGKSTEAIQKTREDFSQVTVTDLEPRYLIRDHVPHSYDIALCKFIGNAMVDAAMAGYTDCMVTRWRGRYALVPLRLSTFATNQVDPSDYFYRMMVEKYRLYGAPGSPAETQSADPAALEQRLRRLLELTERSEAAQPFEASLALAKKAHAGQTRKQGGDYLVHPLRVAMVVAEEAGRREMDLICAALLHDALEDAPDRISLEQIEAAAGSNVVTLVQALTGPGKEQCPQRAERDRRKAELVEAGPPEAWLLKLADRIDNLRDACWLKGPEHREYVQSRIDDTQAHYLPLALRLGNTRLLHALARSLEELRDNLRSRG
jgi:6-phosphofructokinase